MKEKGKKFFYAYNDKEMDAKLAERNWTRKECSIQRYKGLGEMSAEQLWETTMNPESRIILQVSLDDAMSAESAITDLMGNDVAEPSVKVSVCPVNENVRMDVLMLTQKLRAAGIPSETEMMGRNLRKQLEYVSKKNIPFAVIVGPSEIKSGKYTLRDMKTGNETKATEKMIVSRMEKA